MAKEAVVIVLDVGPGVAEDVDGEGRSFMEKSKLCATMIIERKIFSEAKDEIGLILIGSENSNNPLADGENYRFVDVVSSLQLPNWDMVHTIGDRDKPSSVDGDWLDGLVVALDYMKTSTEGKKFSGKKIVVFTNFRSDVSDDEVECIINGIKQLGVQIIVIGPSVYIHHSQDTAADDSRSKPKPAGQAAGEKLIAHVVSETDGVICSFDDALPQLMYFERKKIRPMPWNVVMDIGSEIRIPVSGYKKIDDISRQIAMKDFIIPPRSKFRHIQVESTSEQHQVERGDKPLILDKDLLVTADKPVIVDKDKVYTTCGDEPVAVDFNDVITGYKFGATTVPVSEIDNQLLDYQSGPRCLSILGFTNPSNVARHYLVGKGCMYIVPQKEERCMKAFAALVQAMRSKKKVGIARKIYNNNNSPVIGALYPKGKCQCLTFIELPYAEDLRPLLFPPLVNEKNKPTAEQLNAVDQLIENMDLMTAAEGDDGEPSEALRPKNCLNPAQQHFYHVVARKALQRDSNVTQLDESVEKLLVPLPSLVKRTEKILQRISDLFPLSEIKPKEGLRRAAADIFKMDSNISITSVTKPSDTSGVERSKLAKTSIGTVRPDEDFLNLIAQGVAFTDACSMMQSVIFELVSQAFDSDDFVKPLRALTVMRQECCVKNPSVYNSWVRQLRKELPPGKRGFWELLVRDKLSLISSSESTLSVVSPEEAGKFLEEGDSSDVQTQQEDKFDDFDELLDQM